MNFSARNFTWHYRLALAAALLPFVVSEALGAYWEVAKPHMSVFGGVVFWAVIVANAFSIVSEFIALPSAFRFLLFRHEFRTALNYLSVVAGVLYIVWFAYAAWNISMNWKSYAT